MELLGNGKKGELPASTSKASFQAVKTFVLELRHTKTQIFTANTLNCPFSQRKYKGVTQVHIAAIKRGKKKKADKPPLPPFFPVDIKGKKSFLSALHPRKVFLAQGIGTKALCYLFHTPKSAEQGHPKGPFPGFDPKSSPGSLSCSLWTLPGVFRLLLGYPWEASA